MKGTIINKYKNDILALDINQDINPRQLDKRKYIFVKKLLRRLY